MKCALCGATEAAHDDATCSFGFTPNSDKPRPRVVNMRAAPFDVYVGRARGNGNPRGAYGNPFSDKPSSLATFIVPTAEVLTRYEAWLRAPEQAELRAKARRELRGKVLGCYCAGPAGLEPGVAGGDGVKCHGQILAKVADEEEE